MPRLAGEHAVPLRALIERSLLEHPVHPALGAQVVEMANDLPRYRLVLQPGVGPKAADETPNYRPLKPQYDAVLEMTVTRVGARPARTHCSARIRRRAVGTRMDA
jgi:hypothetical protein